MFFFFFFDELYNVSAIQQAFKNICLDNYQNNIDKTKGHDIMNLVR